MMRLDGHGGRQRVKTESPHGREGGQRLKEPTSTSEKTCSFLELPEVRFFFFFGTGV
jgi:hypothetical protein